MSDLFNAEGRFFKLVAKIVNLLVLNTLWVIFSVPIITMGTATSALYYVTLKLIKDEEGAVIKSFWKAFRQNLRQGIIIEIIFLVAGVILLGDIKYFLMIGGVFGTVIAAIFAIGFVIYLFMLNITFPLIARYEDTVAGTLRNAFVLSFKHLSTSIAMLILLLITSYGFYVSVPIMTLVLLIGVSTYAYVGSILFRHIFDRYE